MMRCVDTAGSAVAAILPLAAAASAATRSALAAVAHPLSLAPTDPLTLPCRRRPRVRCCGCVDAAVVWSTSAASATGRSVAQWPCSVSSWHGFTSYVLSILLAQIGERSFPVAATAVASGGSLVTFSLPDAPACLL